MCLGTALLLGLAAGCGRSAPRPPVLLLTVHGLRADAVGSLGGAPGLTPRLDAFAAAATWRARAVAPASGGAPALASLFTGLRPWQTQVLYDGMPLSRQLSTLPATLAAAGYKTAGFTEDPTLRRAGTLIQGFEMFQAQTQRARGELERRLCGPEPGFLWAHFDLVSNGYHRHEAFLSKVGATGTLPERITRGDLVRWSDAAAPATAEERAAAVALYRSGVAEADAQIGDLLDALRDCRHFDAALVAVVGDHGESLGEDGSFGHGGGLGRGQIEVPLLVKLPRGTDAVAIPPAERLSTTRLYATVLSALALPVPPGVAPALGVRDSGGAESEAYRLNGENLFSLVEGDIQILRSVRFAPADPEYAAARRAAFEPAVRAGLLRPPKAMINQLTRAFRRALPYRDRGDVTLELRRWRPDGGSEPLSDPPTLARLDRQLERAWFRFVAEELTPADARRR